MLIYHGIPKWDSRNDMSMCFNKDTDNDLKCFIPMFNYISFDLGQVKDDKLLGNIEYMIAVKIMKYIHKNLLTALRDVLVMLSDYLVDKSLTNDLKTFLNDMISYIDKSEEIKPENITELIETVENSELKEVLMTLEKRYEIKYRKEGKIEGKIEKTLEIA